METLRNRRRRDTREQIIDSAWSLASEAGIAGVSLRELASQVGMKAPSLYTYFASKDAMYDEMFARGYDELTTAMAVVVERTKGEDRLERLAVAAEEFVAFCQASPARYALMFTRAVPGWEPSPEAYAHSVANFEQMTNALAEVGLDTPQARDLYIAIVAGIAAQQMANDPGGDHWRKLARTAMRMLLNDQAKNGKDTK